jgi:hypothetical protein
MQIKIILRNMLQSFIGTDRSEPVQKSFIYWYGWHWTIQLLVQVIILDLQIKSGVGAASGQLTINIIVAITLLTTRAPLLFCTSTIMVAFVHWYKPV